MNNTRHNINLTMQNVKPKKQLGQHFLTSQQIAKDIVDALTTNGNAIEIGPGMGVLSRYLFQRPELNMRLIEVDGESVDYLKANYPEKADTLVFGDFLRLDADSFFGEGENFSVIGNFPYNISSQIFFRILEYKDRVPMIVGMLQREVAQRLSSGPGTRDYGILSVFLQAYYDIEYLFTVHEDVFNPPPKVKSGVIRLTRNSVTKLDCDEALFRRVVKATFGQRRKTIWNGLKSLGVNLTALQDDPVMKKRPEQLSVADFVNLTNKVASQIPRQG